ncbi:SRPBCC family protein [Rhodococcus sp. HNM0569]|uniref:SRPBCC family protein n=1 Tax=Rhodococcus sp. HNM0569 TaxID=2716340 RepID=UPI00146A183C|nr:SRPBCC family protein [Rhodococcus sp. HNM0569]NLU82524.1 SRPBCC family protein [Rhodococcus sp. HNM0569]
MTARDSADALTYSESVYVECAPGPLYDLVADVTRTGEWSPVCTACWWDEGDGARVGAWFTGRNETPDRTWETRSQVAVAEPGQEFAFVVGGSLVRWGYTLEPRDSGTVLTESWHLLPDGLAFFDERFGDDAPAQVRDRTEAAHAGIPATLAAIKRIAEVEFGQA